MYTPLDIENKKFSKQMVNGYSVEEVDDFLDELTIDYEKIYKQVGEATKKASDMEEELKKYKNKLLKPIHQFILYGLSIAMGIVLGKFIILLMKTYLI